MELINNLFSKATTAASDAAAAKAAEQYEKYKPVIWLGMFLAATLYLFYFVPRFRLPWEKTTA